MTDDINQITNDTNDVNGSPRKTLPTDALRSGAGTDVGRRREENQDSFGIIEGEQFKLYIVADGMGGAKGGAIASQLAIRTMKESIGTKPSITTDMVSEVILEANDAIFQQSLEDSSLSGMGTTLVALFFSGTALSILHVGDSRAYRLRGETLDRLTEDHTLVSELVRAGAITEEQAQNHPVSHMLTRSLGPSSEISVDRRVLSDGPIRGDRYLLCSDGLYNMVPEPEILRLLSSSTIDESVESLLKVANENGGTDNITAMVIDVLDDYPVGIEDITSDVSTLYRKNKKPVPEEATVESNTAERQESPPRSESRIRHALMRTGMVGVGICLGAVLTMMLKDQPVVNNQGELSKTVLISGKPPVPEVPTIATTTYDSSPELLAPAVIELGATERSNIERRLQSVSGRKEAVVTRVALLDQASEGAFTDLLSKNNLEVEALTARGVTIRDQLDVSARLLSVWFGRKKRLDTEDTITLANEVAVSVPDVRGKKEEFEAVTWEYLQAAEQLRLTPSNAELEKKVADLVKLRAEKIREVMTILRSSIERALSSADKQISDLTLEQDNIRKDIDRLRSDNDFVEKIIKSSPEERAVIRQQLNAEREALLAEASELQAILTPR